MAKYRKLLYLISMVLSLSNLGACLKATTIITFTELVTCQVGGSLYLPMSFTVEDIYF
jgi:hypothetical protein